MRPDSFISNVSVAQRRLRRRTCLEYVCQDTSQCTVGEEGKDGCRPNVDRGTGPSDDAAATRGRPLTRLQGSRQGRKSPRSATPFAWRHGGSLLESARADTTERARWT